MRQFVFNQFHLGPFVIFAAAEHKFYFVVGLEVFEVFVEIAMGFAAGGCFQVDDAHDRTWHVGYRISAAGFQQHVITFINQRLEQGDAIGLGQGLAAAVGMVRGVFGAMMIFAANWLAKRFFDEGIF